MSDPPKLPMFQFQAGLTDPTVNQGRYAVPTVDKKKQWLDYFAETASVSEACKLCDLGRHQVFRWRLDDKEFALSWDSIVTNHLLPHLEDAAITRALSEKSDLMLIFLLKSLKREVYDDKMAASANKGRKPRLRITIEDANDDDSETTVEVTEDADGEQRVVRRETDVQGLGGSGSDEE